MGFIAGGFLPKEFEKYKLKHLHKKTHNLLYFATVYIDKGGITATKSVILSTLSILGTYLKLMIEVPC